jgi:hypothetical protein
MMSTALSPGLLVAVKVVLGVAGFAGFALLGAGGALLIRHWLTSDSGSDTSSAHVAPLTQTQPWRGPPASSVTSSTIVPALPAQAGVSSPDASIALPSQSRSASASATVAARSAAVIEAPTRTARLDKPQASTHTQGRPLRGVNSQGSATSAAADKAGCLATLNAVTADLSLRNEPPSPQQLAILKRGCK